MNWCEVCNQGPAERIVLRSASSRILYFNRWKVDAVLCAMCAEYSYLNQQTRTLSQGWWGPLSAGLTIFYSISNIKSIRAHRRLIPKILYEEGEFPRPHLNARSNPGVIIATLVLFIASIILISWPDSSLRDSEGLIIKQGELYLSELQVGDCLVYKFRIGDTEDGEGPYPVVPCSQPHNWQIYYSSYIDNLSENMSLKFKAEKVCEEGLIKHLSSLNESFFMTYQGSDGYLFWPSRESWEDGDRSVTCLFGSNTALYSDSFLDEKFQK